MNSAVTDPGPAAAAFDWPGFVAVADAVVPRFAEKTRSMPVWIDSGILFSDGLCFCAMCELEQVDYIVEAGTGFGGSTEMFARYFDEGHPVRRIWSVDRAATAGERLLGLANAESARYLWPRSRKAHEVAAGRLKGFPHVTLVRGDAFDEVPALVDRLAAEPARVAVLIDGPKAGPQMVLAERLLAQSPQVRFVGVDDIGPKYDAEGRYRRFRRSPSAVFATSDRAFFDRYRAINDGRLPAFMARNPASTGYGLGILVNRSR